MQIFKKKSTSGGHKIGSGSLLSKEGRKWWRWPLNLDITAVNLLFIAAFVVQMQCSQAETKQPIMIDSTFSQPSRLQLCFRPMGKYAASTFTSHIQISFNYSSLIGLQHKRNSQLDNFFNVLKRWNFTALPENDFAMLKSTFQLYKGNTDEIFKLFQDLLTILPHVHERHRCQLDVASSGPQRRLSLSPPTTPCRSQSLRRPSRLSKPRPTS